MTPLGLGLGLGFNRGVGGLDGYSPETLAYLAAMPNNTFSVDEKTALNAFIISIKAAGIWDKIDQLYLLCGKTTNRNT